MDRSTPSHDKREHRMHLQIVYLRTHLYKSKMCFVLYDQDSGGVIRRDKLIELNLPNLKRLKTHSLQPRLN
jgi:hypothetical protein